MPTKAPHLVLYDYGTGAIWALVTAESGDAIRRKCPLLQIVANRPAWMSDAAYERIARYDIDQEPDDFLRSLVAEHR